MNEYLKGKFTIYSDFEIRKLREDNGDIDLLIPLDLRTLNLYIENMPEFLSDRLQFNSVRNIILRFNTADDNNLCTIHLLDSVDILSSIVNFTLDYSNHWIIIVKDDYSSSMYIKSKENKGMI